MSAADDIGLLVIDPRRRHTILAANYFAELVAGPLTGRMRPVDVVFPNFQCADVFDIEPRCVKKLSSLIMAQSCKTYPTEIELLPVYDRVGRLDFYVIAVDLSQVPRPVALSR